MKMKKKKKKRWVLDTNFIKYVHKFYWMQNNLFAADVWKYVRVSVSWLAR